jgi:DNA (cytosine-5)-methyltransferase 1
MINKTPKEVLLDYYNFVNDNLKDDFNCPNSLIKDLNVVLSRITSSKGVFTVLTTLSLYKVINPSQDIRQHKKELHKGFSGRSFDTAYVTPTLKELGLPSMAESGWLTRSLEQAYPYDKNFNGKITPVELKDAFLNLVDFIQNSKESAEIILKSLLAGAIKYTQENVIIINKIEKSELPIANVISLLKSHFEEKYTTHGGSKLPVIAFYSIYKLLTKQLVRYYGMSLLELGSHTASDRTSRSAGDIQILNKDKIYEAIEIKLDKPINVQMINIAYEKINKFKVERYYILSGAEPQEVNKEENKTLIEKIRNEHGCQLIANGLYNSLKYYLRLISSVNDFLNIYIELVTQDKELQKCHKEKLFELVENL